MRFPFFSAGAPDVRDMMLMLCRWRALARDCYAAYQAYYRLVIFIPV